MGRVLRLLSLVFGGALIVLGAVVLLFGLLKSGDRMGPTGAGMVIIGLGGLLLWVSEEGERAGVLR